MTIMGDEVRLLMKDNERAQAEIEHLDGQIQTLLNENELMRAALQECADDLEVEVRARFADSAGMVHPALRQRYERDMGPVVRARAALERERG